MPWFAAKPTGPAWGWHWTMNAFDPDKSSSGKRRIASHYYPLIGPYDSGDPAVIEYHLLLMKLAGIDGVIADWYGLSDQFSYPLEHRNTARLFEDSARLGLQIAVCYEDQTITKLVGAGRLPVRGRVRHACAELNWLHKNWFARPAYVKIDGKPLLLSFGNDGLTDEEWQQVLPGTADVAYLSEHHRRRAATGAFDWPVPKEYPTSLDRYYNDQKKWPLAMPVAFPRFHDIYAEAKVHPSWGRIPDDGGHTFAKTLDRALKTNHRLVQICTWNDWGEGTQVEPSVEFGYRDLEVLQQARRRFDPRFSFKPDDLRLPHRLFMLRRNGVDQASCDRITQFIAGGNLAEARTALQRETR
jgi:hypothetical protein